MHTGTQLANICSPSLGERPLAGCDVAEGDAALAVLDLLPHLERAFIRSGKTTAKSKNDGFQFLDKILSSLKKQKVRWSSLGDPKWPPTE